MDYKYDENDVKRILLKIKKKDTTGAVQDMKEMIKKRVDSEVQDADMGNAAKMLTNGQISRERFLMTCAASDCKTGKADKAKLANARVAYEDMLLTELVYSIVGKKR